MTEKQGFERLSKETLLSLYLHAKPKADAYDELRAIVREMLREDDCG